MINQTLFSLMNGISGRYGFLDFIIMLFAVYGIYVVYCMCAYLHNLKQVFEAGTAALLGFGIKLAINYIYPIARPAGTLLIKLPSSPSFPSGHAVVSFAIATAIFRHNKHLGAYAFLLALLISISRIFAGVHYPLDILAGAVIGILCGFSVKYLFKKK